MQQPHFTMDNDIAKLCDEDSDCDSDNGLDFFEDEEGSTNRVMLFFLSLTRI